MASINTQNRGYSLIELCVCTAVSSVLLGLALPSIEHIKQRQRLAAAAETLMTDLQEARSLAVSRADSVQVRFNRHPNGSCYIVHTGSTGECQCNANGETVCSNDDRVLKRTWIPSSQKLELRSNVSSFSFQARQGAVTSTGSIDIQSVDGESIRHIVSIAGRVRTCSPSGGIRHYPRC
ncbi:GspH/FimT family pseudopilin [Roseateles sp.]|uniref:GspH/FimT family pseudopilin n=1 Tax=Roseateles sp. TaxID=1971397 RepID=UPI003BA69C2A